MEPNVLAPAQRQHCIDMITPAAAWLIEYRHAEPREVVEMVFDALVRLKAILMLDEAP
jgi:hypothetical protein